MHRRLSIKTALLAGAASALVAAPAYAQDANARIAALEAQLAELATQLTALKESTSAVDDDLSARINATTTTIPNGKPTFTSVDGQFTGNLRGTFHVDTAQYFQDDNLPAAVTTSAGADARDFNSGTNIRRARIGVDGKLFRDFDYSILYDFGGSGTDGAGQLQEAFVQYNGITFPNLTIAGAAAPLRIRAGAFAPNLGLADAASTNGSLFPERPSGAELARNLAGADRRIGLQIGTNTDRWLAYAAVTGAKTTDAATFDEQLGYTARVAGTPFKGYDWLVHTGVNGSIVAQPAQTGAGLGGATNIALSDRPELRVDGSQLIGTGNILAKGARHYGAELALQKANFLLQGEYFEIEVQRRNAAAGVQDPKFSGYYVEGSWFVTKEPRRYNLTTGAFDGPTVLKPFDLKAKTWGAWELAARYSVADLNDDINSAIVANRVRGGKQEVTAAAVNWFLNAGLRASVTYSDVKVDRLNAAGVQAGQDFQAINLRTQFAF